MKKVTAMVKRVVVTGLGLVSPVGITVQDAWKNVLNGVSGITKLGEQQYINIPCKVAGRIIEGKEENQLNIEKYVTERKLRGMSKSTCYAYIAAKQAILDAKWNTNDGASKEETGVSVGTGMVDLNDINTSQTMLNKNYKSVSPFFIPKISPNMAASQISIEYGFQGPNHSVSTACATGAHAIGDGFNFIKHGKAKIMVCGSTDACINPLSIAGFCRMKALSTLFNDEPWRSSRPFDKKRDGFVVGEGAAIVILEELNHATERKIPIYAEIKGYGMSGDAAHLTAPHECGKGAVLAMNRAISDAEVALSDISYINAHATSTQMGDVIELGAIKTVFDKHCKNLTISSTKGVHGHLLGAAGSLETLFTILACFQGILPPNANIEECCDEGISLNCISSQQDWNRPHRIALKNSFGFGGTNACLCISEFKFDT